jgi:hypothetical protein
MRRVLDAVKRMPASEGIQLLVKAGLMSESEAEEAVKRHIQSPQGRSKRGTARGR